MLVDGGSQGDERRISDQIKAVLNTSIPDHYSPELQDFIDRLLTVEVSFCFFGIDLRNENQH
jgi:hypothetical protein